MPAIGVRDSMGTITARASRCTGELDPTDKLVFDFLELKRIMRLLCGEIDHLVLLPSRARAFTWPKMLR